MVADCGLESVLRILGGVSLEENLIPNYLCGHAEIAANESAETSTRIWV